MLMVVSVGGSFVFLFYIIIYYIVCLFCGFFCFYYEGRQTHGDCYKCRPCTDEQINLFNSIIIVFSCISVSNFTKQTCFCRINKIMGSKTVYIKINIEAKINKIALTHTHTQRKQRFTKQQNLIPFPFTFFCLLVFFSSKNHRFRHLVSFARRLY